MFSKKLREQTAQIISYNVEPRIIISISIDYRLLVYQWSQRRTASLVSLESNLAANNRETQRVLVALRSFDKFYGIEERTIFWPNSARVHCVDVFPTISSDRSTFVPARDRWIAVIQPGDTATGYSLSYTCPPPSHFHSPPSYRVNLDLDLYSSKRRAPSRCSVKYREITYLQN